MAVLLFADCRMSDDDKDDHANLLSILHSHGQEFMKSFSLPTPNTSKKRKGTDEHHRRNKIPKTEAEDDVEEWFGFEVQDGEDGHDCEHGSLNAKQSSHCMPIRLYTSQ
jgi:hypothetical protein